MNYSPINFRRMYWSSFNQTWRDIQQQLNPSQVILTKQAYRGSDLPNSDYNEPRSYLSYFLE